VSFNTFIGKLQDTKLAFLVSNKYAEAAVVLMFTVITLKILAFVIEKTVLRITRKTKTDLDDKIVEAIRKPAIAIFIALGIYFSTISLQLSNKWNSVINKILLSAGIIILTVIAVRIISAIISVWGEKWAKKTKSTVDDRLLPIISKTSKVAVWMIGLIIILKTWGIDVTGIVAGLGVAGIAIGFAVKDSLANIFGGVQLILDKAIKVGDKIELDTGEIGIVQDIGLRSTKLKTYNHELILVPNGRLANAKVKNYTLPDTMSRVVVPFGVEYGTKIENVQNLILKKVVPKIKNALKDPAPAVEFVEMGQFSLNFKCKVWVDDYTQAYSTKLELTKRIYDELSKAGVNIPFPTQEIYLKNFKK